MKLALVSVLASQLALGADPVDAGTGPAAIAVESATLRPLDAPTVPLEVGRGVYLPESLAVTVAGKTEAYDAAKASQGVTPIAPSSTTWLVVGAVVVAAAAGFAVGWAARPTAAQ